MRALLLLLVVWGCSKRPLPLNHELVSHGFVDAGDGIKLSYKIAGTHGDTIVVLHGGPGFSMGYIAPDLEPLTARHLPKPLFPLGGKVPLAEIWVRRMVEAGIVAYATQEVEPRSGTFAIAATRAPSRSSRSSMRWVLESRSRTCWRAPVTPRSAARISPGCSSMAVGHVTRATRSTATWVLADQGTFPSTGCPWLMRSPSFMPAADSRCSRTPVRKDVARRSNGSSLMASMA